jgi:hypothetical protein
MGRTTEMQSRADQRAERHARTFMRTQKPKIDPRVSELAAQGYNALQIASLLRLPAIDVRLMLATQNEVRR